MVNHNRSPENTSFLEKFDFTLSSCIRIDFFNDEDKNWSNSFARLDLPLQGRPQKITKGILKIKYM